MADAELFSLTYNELILLFQRYRQEEVALLDAERVLLRRIERYLYAILPVNELEKLLADDGAANVLTPSAKLKEKRYR